MRPRKAITTTLAWGSGHPHYTCQLAAPLPEVVPTRSRRGLVVVRLLRGPAPVRQARQLTRGALIQWGLAHRAADAALAVSEIATNALTHGQAPAILLLRRETSPHGPVASCTVINRGGWRTRVTVTDEGGRGLLIARQIADALTVHTNKLRTAVTARFNAMSADQP
jgi:anti-sigma regulatory factor (Ser/Thr protein kinase)